MAVQIRRAYSIVKMMMEMNSTRIRILKSQSGIANVQMKTERTLKTISDMMTESKILLARRSLDASALYSRELERRLKDMGIVNLLAGVACAEEGDEYVPPDSYRFHLKEGYSEVARMKSVGFKFSRWYDLAWLQKKIRQAE